MKILTVMLLMYSMSAFALWNEVECEGKVPGKTFKVEVEKTYHGGPIFRPAFLKVKENEVEKTYDYSVSTRVQSGWNRIEYAAYGLRLDVDLSPHAYPRFGWIYRATLASDVLDNQYIQGVRCRFPNAY